jgi:hypothetical protein
MFHFPHPTAAVQLSIYVGQRWKPFDRMYNNYEDIPVLESLQIDCNPYKLAEEPYYHPGLWTHFRYHGYCLWSSFSQMFYLGPPIKLMDHILPVGITEDYEPTLQMNNYITGEGNIILIRFSPLHRAYFRQIFSSLRWTNNL